ncbi:MAG: GDP-L-fucose synthase [Holophagaceae bacterium]
MDSGSTIFVAGAHGLVGSAVVRKLRSEGYANLLLPTRTEVDLTDQAAVYRYFELNRPEFVFLVAGRVGGILANSTFPADFIRDNIMIQSNVIDAAYRHGARKLLDLGSSCIYPRQASQPMTEDSLLSGPLEPTNEWYAIAKIAGLKMCQAYRRQHGFNAICLMPTNLYGPGDNFDLEGSHVLPAMIRKFHEAKVARQSEVFLWGTGSPKREFLHVDDLAEACIYFMQHYEGEAILNVGVGADVTIQELAELVRDVVGFRGTLRWDHSKPDGTPRKLLDVSRARELGWKANTELRQGVASTYRWFVENRTSEK